VHLSFALFLLIGLWTTKLLYIRAEFANCTMLMIVTNSCIVPVLLGDIVASNTDQSNITGDHGSWNPHLGRSFL